MNSVHGKWVLITGATSGIGRACAEVFARNNANLILTGRREDRLEAARNVLNEKYGVTVKTYCFDVREFTEAVKMANDLNESGIVPDILINNAGLASGKDKIFEGLLSDWEKMIDTNIKGLLYITRAILPMMVDRNQGHVINIGSTAGHSVYPEGNVYNASKYAVKALNEGINMDLVGTKLRCCSVDPGACETEFSLVRFHGDRNKADKVYQGYEPLHPEDVADTVFYVCNSPEHVNITNIVMYPTAQRSVFVWDKK